jgi:hypothetical protein
MNKWNKSVVRITSLTWLFLFTPPTYHSRLHPRYPGVCVPDPSESFNHSAHAVSESGLCPQGFLAAGRITRPQVFWKIVVPAFPIGVLIPIKYHSRDELDVLRRDIFGRFGRLERLFATSGVRLRPRSSFETIFKVGKNLFHRIKLSARMVCARVTCR